MRTPSVLIVFLDGFGIGAADPDRNPLFAAPFPSLERLFGGRMISRGDSRRETRELSVRPVNATLGVGGLPQSGTGQTAILTGVNAPKLIGRHFGPYPYSTLRPVLAERNIFRTLSAHGISTEYANAFPQRYFDYLTKHPSRTSAITSAWLAAGFRLHDHGDVMQGKALPADITGEGWNRMGFAAVPEHPPDDRGAFLVHLLERHRLVFFEYFMTDHAGHSQSPDEALRILRLLDGFFGGILDALTAESLLVVISDHGNLEDLSVKTHTRNPVPLVAAGAHHRRIAARIRRLTDVAPAITDLLM
jgi:hypothetical protein